MNELSSSLLHILHTKHLKRIYDGKVLSVGLSVCFASISVERSNLIQILWFEAFVEFLYGRHVAVKIFMYRACNFRCYDLQTELHKQWAIVWKVISGVRWKYAFIIFLNVGVAQSAIKLQNR